MKKLFLVFLSSISLFSAQNVVQKLDTATKNLLSTDAAFSANLSFYVADEAGKLVYEYNGNRGLSTASTQKIFTAAAALETLGKNYTYTTTASYSGNIAAETLNGTVFLASNGDPTLGSWRYENWKPENFKEKLLSCFKKLGISKISGNLMIDDSYFDFQTIPGGWPWNDVGNYYGSGVFGVNWRENQFDIDMYGKDFKKFSYHLENVKWINELKTGGNSDQSIIYTAPFSDVALINGTLPAGKTTTVSGSTPNPPLQLGLEIKKWLSDAGIVLQGEVVTYSQLKIQGKELPLLSKKTDFFSYQSPTMDKMVYWFMKKSVNLYGETLIKTLGKEKKGIGSFDAGVDYLKSFWKSKGIATTMINFADGSGLSPQNYVAAKAEVQALVWSKKQPWFDVFYDGFPVQGNGMKMKSGSLKNTKSFAGYHTSASGKTYVFAIIINNYQGSAISDALYQVLNHLK